MFILTEIEEDVKVAPADLSLPPLDAVTEVIEKRFLDKVRGSSGGEPSLEGPHVTCMGVCDLHGTCKTSAWELHGTPSMGSTCNPGLRHD